MFKEKKHNYTFGNKTRDQTKVIDVSIIPEIASVYKFETNRFFRINDLTFFQFFQKSWDSSTSVVSNSVIAQEAKLKKNIP